MTLQEQMLQQARTYLWNDLPTDERDIHSVTDFKLNKQLQYMLCNAFDRLVCEFGEVTNKDVAMLVEAWIMAQGTLSPNKPLRRGYEP